MFGLTRRDWIFAAIAWVLLVAGVIGLSLMMADADAKATGAFFARLIAVMFGPPLAIGGASLAVLRLPRRMRKAWVIAGLMFGVLMLAMFGMLAHSGMRHAPRYLAYGKLRGTVAQVAPEDAASVEVTPAYVDIRRLGHGSETSTDSKGHSHTRHVYMSPIVSAEGERDLDAAPAQPISLFLCDSDEDDLREAAERTGAVSGRMYPVHDRAEQRALEELTSVVKAPGRLQCVVPTSGWFVFWWILWILLVVVATVGGAVLALAITKDAAT